MVRWRARSFVDTFRRRPFRRFWLGYTGSLLGDAMTRVALVWFVYERTRSATAVGWPPTVPAMPQPFTTSATPARV